MRVQAYAAYAGSLIVTVATPRPETAPSTIFTAASIHEDFCAKVRVVMQEHKHIEATALAWPVAQRIQTYLPTYQFAPIYALRQLMPAGAPRDIDQNFQLEIMRIRYEFMLVRLPASFICDQLLAEGQERNMEKAVNDLFAANSVPNSFIPGDSGIRNEQDVNVPTRSEIDIVCEMGPAIGNGRAGFEMSVPTS